MSKKNKTTYMYKRKANLTSIEDKFQKRINLSSFIVFTLSLIVGILTLVVLIITVPSIINMMEFRDKAEKVINEIKVASDSSATKARLEFETKARLEFDTNMEIIRCEAESLRHKIDTQLRSEMKDKINAAQQSITDSGNVVLQKMEQIYAEAEVKKDAIAQYYEQLPPGLGGTESQLGKPQDETSEIRKNAEDWFNKGYLAKDYDEKINCYTNAIELFTDDNDKATAYYNRGVVKHNKDDYDGAIADYSKAIELKPDYAKAYNNRGVAKSNNEDFDGAIEDYTKAIDLYEEDNDKADAYYSRGFVKVEKKDYDGAIADFDKAIDYIPDDDILYYARGLVKSLKSFDTENEKEKRKWFQEAIKDLEEALRLNPELEDAKMVMEMIEQMLAELD